MIRAHLCPSHLVFRFDQHVLADTLGSVGVIISTLLINRYGWTGFDPLASIFIAVLIFASVVPLVADSAKLLVLNLGEEKEVEVRKALTAVSRLLSDYLVRENGRALRLDDEFGNRCFVSKVWRRTRARGSGRKIPRRSSGRSGSSSRWRPRPCSTMRRRGQATLDISQTSKR